jgi:hypothetical protein
MPVGQYRETDGSVMVYDGAHSQSIPRELYQRRRYFPDFDELPTKEVFESRLKK